MLLVSRTFFRDFSVEGPTTRRDLTMKYTEKKKGESIHFLGGGRV